MEKQLIRHQGTGELREWAPGDSIPVGPWDLDPAARVVFPEWWGAIPDPIPPKERLET
jgi:hypothetical protein